MGGGFEHLGMNQRLLLKNLDIQDSCQVNIPALLSEVGRC